MIGEWLFSFAAFGEEVDRAKSFRQDFPEAFAYIEKHAGVSADELQHLREVVAPKFVTGLAEDIVATSPRVVGFTSTFEQNVASVAAARAIKKLNSQF